MKTRAFGDNWNFWVVKYLRQMNHNKSLLLGVVLMGVIQFLILQNTFGDRYFSPIWPWVMPMMLNLCGIGTVLCVALGFASQTGKRGETRPGISHFMDFSPVEEWELFRGLLWSALLTFGVFAVSCTPIWLTMFYYMPERIGSVMLSLLTACCLTLFFIQPCTKRMYRIDIVVAIIFLVGWMMPLTELPGGALLPLAALLGGWQLLNFRESLRLPAEVSEVWMRVGQLVLLLAGWGMFYPPLRLNIPILVMMGALGPLASMARVLSGIPQRQRETFPTSRFLRFFAFFLYGSSAGGWFWCWAAALAGGWILGRFPDSAFWMFLLPWGLFWAELVFLLMRVHGTRKNVETIFHFELAAGLVVTGVMLALAAIVSVSVKSNELFLAAARIGWIAAAVMILPLLPRIRHDFRLFRRGRDA